MWRHIRPAVAGGIAQETSIMLVTRLAPLNF